MISTTELPELGLEFLSFDSAIGHRLFQKSDRIIAGVLISILAICVACSLLLNSFVLKFYWNKVADTIPYLFILVAVGDIATGIAGIFNIAALLVYQLVDFPEDNPGFVDPYFRNVVMANYVWTNLALKVSVFFNVVLAVVRTISIVNPFRQLRKRRITLYSLFYLGLWVFIVGGEVYYTHYGIVENWEHYEEKFKEHPDFNDNSQMFMYAWYFLFTNVPGYVLSVDGVGQIEEALYCSNSTTCSYQFCYNAGGIYSHEECESFFGFFWLMIPNVLPAAIVLACLVIIWRTLTRGTVSNETSEASNRHTTVSVLLLSAVYIVSNTISFFFIIIVTFTPLLKDHHGGVPGKVFSPSNVRTFYWLMFVFQNIFPQLCSLLNPMVIILRGAVLKKSFKEAVGSKLRMTVIGHVE